MGARILVVDDSNTIRRVVCGILERHGFEPAPAADGQLAVEAIASAETPFDLVLLDFVMPKMNGFQFCRAIRAREEWKRLPVLLMSAKTDRIREQFVQQTGAIDAITKPFDAQALVAAVENALKRVASGHVVPALQLLQLEAQTGTLAMWNADSEITIHMRGGLVDLVQSRGAGDEFRLGRFFLEEELVTEDQLEELVRSSQIPPASGPSSSKPSRLL